MKNQIESILTEFIDSLKDDENEEKKMKKEHLEKEIIGNIEQFCLNEKLYQIPFEIFENIIKNCNLLQLSDPYLTLKTIFENSSQNYKEKSISLLNIIKTNNLSLTLDEYIDIISSFTFSDILSSIQKLYSLSNKEVDVDYDFVIQQKDKEISELKQNLYIKPFINTPDSPIVVKKMFSINDFGFPVPSSETSFSFTNEYFCIKNNNIFSAINTKTKEYKAMYLHGAIDAKLDSTGIELICIFGSNSEGRVAPIAFNEFWCGYNPRFSFSFSDINRFLDWIDEKWFVIIQSRTVYHFELHSMNYLLYKLEVEGEITKYIHSIDKKWFALSAHSNKSTPKIQIYSDIVKESVIIDGEYPVFVFLNDELLLCSLTNKDNSMIVKITQLTISKQNKILAETIDEISVDLIKGIQSDHIIDMFYSKVHNSLIIITFKGCLYLVDLQEKINKFSFRFSDEVIPSATIIDNGESIHAFTGSGDFLEITNKHYKAIEGIKQ